MHPFLLDKLVSQIYQASLDAALWPQVLAQICEVLHCATGTFVIAAPGIRDLSVHCAHGIAAEDIALFHREWRDRDPFVRRWDRFPSEECVFAPSHSVITDEELEADECYQRFLRPRGIHYGGGVNILVREGFRSTLTVSRPKSAGPLTGEEIALGSQICPHLRRSVLLTEARLAPLQQNIALQICFQHIAYPVAVFAHAGQILVKNLQWIRLFKTAGPQVADGVMDAVRNSITNMPEMAHSFKFEKHDGTLPYWVTVRPVAIEDDNPAADRRPGALVEIRDPDRGISVDAETVRQVFGLTLAEARLAILLAKGFPLKDTARMLSIGEETARSHLKRSLQKTDSRRQADLINKVRALE